MTITLLAFSLLIGGASRENLLPVALLQLLALPVFGLALLRLVRDRTWRQHRFLLGLAAATAALPLIQLIPLPYGLWTALPGREQAVLALNLAGLEPSWLPLSLTPDATWRAFLALIPPLALLMAALALPRRVLTVMIWVVLAFTVGAIALGGLQVTLGSRSVYFWETTNFGSLVGTFANRNHMATLSVLTLPFAAVLIGSGLNARDEHAGLRIWTGLLLISLVIVALGAIRSRFGLVLVAPSLIGSLLIAWIASGRGRPAPAVLAIAASAAMAMLAVGLFALDPILSRFDSDPANDLRFENWPVVIQAAQDFLPLGSGLGSFDPVYRAYEPAEDLRLAYFNHAHNDYLEIWLETGWAGIALIAVAMIWWGRRAWSTWRAGQHMERDLQRAAAIALLLIGLHSIVDYPLRTQALAAIFVLCCALLEGATQPIRSGRSSRTV